MSVLIKRKKRLLEVGVVVVVAIATAMGILTFTLRTPKSLVIETGIWPASPFDSIPYYSNISDMVVLGRVKSRTDTVEGSDCPGHYYVTISVEEMLKGDSADSLVIRIDQGRENLGWWYRPDILPGENLVIFASAANDTKAAYYTPIESTIWRIEEDLVFNRWGKWMRDQHTKKPYPERRMPSDVRKRWGQTIRLGRFLEIVELAISGRASEVWG